MSNPVLKTARLLILLISMATLSSCSWLSSHLNYHHWFGRGECVDKSSDYLSVEDRAPLAIPPGADTPDRHNMLVVPEGKRNDAKGKCLDKPPSYFGQAGRIAASPEETVADWAQAWSERNADGVISMYSTSYGSTGAVTSLEQRRIEIATGPLPTGRIKGLKVSAVDNEHRLAKFIQTFGSTDVTKEITLVRESGLWKIVDEKVVSAK